jgi:hypothetical protein
VQLRRPCALMIAASFLGILLIGCREKNTLTLRTDTEPLTKRLVLPKALRSVRWVAVSPVHDSGWVPPKTEFYDVYAYIELDDPAWTELEKSAGDARVRGTLVIPDPVAAVLIPPAAMAEFGPSDDGGRRAEGRSFNLAVSDQARTDIEQAIRVGRALVVLMRVH